MIVPVSIELADLDGGIRKKLKKVTKKVGKTLKKGFLKAAPFLSIAAQALNFVVPGLGLAVGLAISMGASALQAKEAAKAAKGAEKAAAEAEAVEAEGQARQQNMTAYGQGQNYFEKTYGMTRAKFEALSLEGQLKFLNLSVYDQNATKMAQAGIAREAFIAMSLDQQSEAIGRIIGGMPATPTDSQVLAVSEGPPIWMLAAVGVGIVGIGLVVIAMTGKKK